MSATLHRIRRTGANRRQRRKEKFTRKAARANGANTSLTVHSALYVAGPSVAHRSPRSCGQGKALPNHGPIWSTNEWPWQPAPQANATANCEVPIPWRFFQTPGIASLRCVGDGGLWSACRPPTTTMRCGIIGPTCQAYSPRGLDFLDVRR